MSSNTLSSTEGLASNMNHCTNRARPCSIISNTFLVGVTWDLISVTSPLPPPPPPLPPPNIIANMPPAPEKTFWSSFCPSSAWARTASVASVLLCQVTTYDEDMAKQRTVCCPTVVLTVVFTVVFAMGAWMSARWACSWISLATLLAWKASDAHMVNKGEAVATMKLFNAFNKVVFVPQYRHISENRVAKRTTKHNRSTNEER